MAHQLVRRNDGRPWQDEILRIARVYRDLGIMRLEKVDAPVKFAGKRVIFMPNPFPDFVGCWHRNGRMIALEAKSTSDGRLGIGVRATGLTDTQCEALAGWHKHGAISGVLWRDLENSRWIPWTFIADALNQHKKAIT
ncbi:MAG: hypothetical protein KGJ13_09120, partial [Patescibacteria group bacterium]|nr:hypothetical protein [Patescibacteria group bacterium]